MLPIDFQDNFTKTQIAEKTQQIQQAHPELVQRGISRAVEREAAQRPRETPPSLQPDQVVIHQDNPRSKPDRRGRHDEGDAPADETDEDDPVGSNLSFGEEHTQGPPRLEHVDVVA